MQRPLIIAHRTCPPYAPENSLTGVRVSFEQGADGVEIDLRMSLDQHPFLMHDNSMWRTTGWPLPIELTPSGIVKRQWLRGPKEAEAGDSQEPGNTIGGGEGPPKLGEVIRLVPLEKILAVDIKTPWAVLALERAVKQPGMASRTLAWCSSGLVVRYASRQLRGVEVAYYKDYEDGPNNIEFIGKAARIGAHAVSLHWLGVNRDVVAAAHSLGLKVYSWHKEYEITAEKVASGLDGLITDHPGMARRAIDTLRV